MSPCVTMGRPLANITSSVPLPDTLASTSKLVCWVHLPLQSAPKSRLTGRGSPGERQGNPQAGQPSTYRHLHRLHREVTWRLQGPGPRGVPESGECSERAEAHERVGGKRADVLSDVSQLWHPKIPEQLVGLHCPVQVVPYDDFCWERKCHVHFREDSCRPRANAGPDGPSLTAQVFSWL